MISRGISKTGDLTENRSVFFDLRGTRHTALYRGERRSTPPYNKNEWFPLSKKEQQTRGRSLDKLRPLTTISFLLPALVDLAPVRHINHENDKLAVVDIAQNPIITDPVSPHASQVPC